MKRYMLSVYQPDGPPPPKEFLDEVIRDLTVLNHDLKAAGAWVFSDGLYPASTSTVVRADGDGVMMTDGPFTEGKEHIGGFTIIEAADLDAALHWAGRMARATTLPVEVRPCQGHDFSDA